MRTTSLLTYLLEVSFFLAGLQFLRVSGWTCCQHRTRPSRGIILHAAVNNKPISAPDATINQDSLASLSPPPQAEQALGELAATTLALLAGDKASATILMGSAVQKKQTVHRLFQTYDVCQSGTLSVQEARALFVDLARSIVTELARPVFNSTSSEEQPLGKQSHTQTREVARAHALRVLNQDETGNTISRVADKLLLLADTDGDGKINLQQLARLFDVVHQSSTTNTTTTVTDKQQQVDTFPQPLRALAGSLQLLPPNQGLDAMEAAKRSAEWNVGVAGDDHTLRRVELTPDVSIVGLGRSADASAYFLPELGIALDAGIHVKSLRPRTVLLTHGHRDHIAALPSAAAGGASIFAPRRIANLVKRYLLAEAQLNFGDPNQTDDETIAALGDYNVEGVADQTNMLLDKARYTGSPTPLGIQVFEAPHKDGVPAVSYGIYRSKKRLKPEYQSLPKNELGALLRDNVNITETYQEGLLFYTGDTTITLLRERWKEILPKYKHVIHEVTFLGPPSADLDRSSQLKGHTHYAQLHPWICAFPETLFICVHWSLRYSRQDILAFFKQQYGGVPKNVVLWC